MDTDGYNTVFLVGPQAALTARHFLGLSEYSVHFNINTPPKTESWLLYLVFLNRVSAKNVAHMVTVLTAASARGREITRPQMRPAKRCVSGVL